MIKNFLYTGPTSGVTLQTAQGAQEILLHTNSQVQLPVNHGYVNTLIALGHLREVSMPNTAKVASVSAKSGKSEKQGE
ncbi:hypothetical protein [Oligella urethralis]|uniref:hypothetical protein n=1 Tax=Oligella urethralis TaxID=90245 RepID=UPI000E044847|nr:hypothetical protein [Oligella urethralis]SUA58107.1 Uncharacterised protein [Oligella urethralis]